MVYLLSSYWPNFLLLSIFVAYQKLSGHCSLPCSLQICLVSKDYSFAQKHILYCFTTFVYITLALLGTRCVTNHWHCLDGIYAWLSLVSVPLNAMIHTVSYFGKFSRGIAVRSCHYESRWSCSLCWWLGRSGCRGSQLLWVITNYIYVEFPMVACFTKEMATAIAPS